MIEFVDKNNALSISETASFTFEVIDKKREEHKPWSPLDVFNSRPFSSQYLVIIKEKPKRKEFSNSKKVSI